MVNLREAAAELWRTLTHESSHHPLHYVYERVQVDQDTRETLEHLLGPSRTQHYIARHEGEETVEFVTDPESGKVLVKKYLAVHLSDRGAPAGCDMRFESTLRVVREILAARTGPKRMIPRGPGRQPAQPRSILEWFTGPATEKLRGRGTPDDTYYINGRHIEPRAYRTLLTSKAGDDLLVEIRTNR